ncbi:MAG: transposase [Cytophagales bacterium]|nr:transposase [Cytophagales bacterium]
MRNTFKYFITGFVVILVHMGFRHIREILLAKYEDTLLTFLYDNQFLFTGLLIIFIFTILTFEKFRATLIEKNTYQKQLIEQLTYNQTLKDEINSELEIKVLEKTQTILEQTQRITEMNDILKKHNIELASALEQKEETIISNRIINYEEYRKKFKDDDACYEFLSQMKWANGFNCKKCNCTYYNFKDSKYVRRCKKCSYVESPTNYTIFENVRFSINKAFYLVYVIHSGKKIKIEELSNDISTRPQTIIEFTKKVKLYISKIPKRKLSRMTWLDLIVHSH